MSEPPQQRPAPRGASAPELPSAELSAPELSPSELPAPKLSAQNYSAQNPQAQPYPLNPAAPYPVQPQYRRAHKPSEELRRDAEAAFAARMELGPEYTEFVAANLAERVEDLAEARAAELRQEAELANRAQAAEQTGRGRQFALAIVSMVMGIPITAISASEVDPSIMGVAISWAGIVGVNWVHARTLRKRK